MTSERVPYEIKGRILHDGLGCRDATAAERWAFAEIERLRAALKDLADAHELTISGEGYDPEHCDCPVLDRARRALA